MEITYKFLFSFTLIIATKAAVSDLKVRVCSIKDDTCVNTFFAELFEQISKKSYPEIGIPTVDPLKIKDITLTMMDTVKITVTDGELDGFSTCKFEKTHFDLENTFMDQILNCDVTTRGQFITEGNNDFLQEVLKTDTLNGNGSVVFSIEQFRVDMTLPFKLQKREANNVYFNFEDHDPKYDYKAKNISMTSDHILFGGKDDSDNVNEYFNSHWEFVMQSLGGTVVTRFIEIYMSILHKFFAAYPASQFIKEDLSANVKN